MLLRGERPSQGCQQAQPSLFLFLFLSLTGRMPRTVERQEKPPPGWEQLSEQWGHKTVKDCGFCRQGGEQQKPITETSAGKGPLTPRKRPGGEKPGLRRGAVTEDGHAVAIWGELCTLTIRTTKDL